MPRVTPHQPSVKLSTSSEPKPEKQAVVPPPAKQGWSAKATATATATARAPTTGFDRPVSRATPNVEANLKKIGELMIGHTDRNEEKQILQMFKGASAAELNALVGEMPQHDFHEMVSDLDDRLIGPDNRNAFLNLLSKDRLGDLTVENRAKLVSALQYHRTEGPDEKAIRDVFLGTKAGDLSALKKAIDHGEDHRDLQQLVFHDIDDPKIRSQVLDHFKKEAAASPSGQVKVLSDIDDTFYANLKDDRYPKKTVYPGVKDFYAELDKGGAAQEDAGGDLMFLSARPYDRAGGSEHLSRSTIEKAGVKDPTVLSGDFAHLIGNDLIADKKFENWEQVRKLHPEYGSVFVGDSGQGDAIFGARAAAIAGTAMKKVFIHNVTDLNDAQRADFKAQGVHIFDTYVGAATEAYQSGLISREGLLRVAAGAQRELAAVAFTSPDQQAAREKDLARDLAAMQVALQSR
jgi:uncharacterized surface protein with fasciclin (FAS1) repeats